MLKALFHAGSVTSRLRTGLDDATAIHRGIATRVATMLQRSSTTDFASALGTAQAGAAVPAPFSEADLQRDMAALADTQLRFEADSKLLQQAYGRLRTAIRDRA